MMMLAPSVELAHVNAELQQVIAVFSAQLSLALVSFTLLSFPYGVIGFLIVSSSLLVAVAELQGEEGIGRHCHWPNPS
ncbi:hypothetical protein GUJ93_ZPchr0004g39797 [Zizania palustris]|uniref:Uncharacterized protein n=1 Tax=Zizania palustris TaxID=103762 RepID=A0A8J5RYR5_ZIZPA|nr:hypothetical protein GUJ93_ZPchr0004g39797 [Zizania palustris]